MTAGSTRLPLTVVGGYLGAGKTTLVNRLLADPRGQRIAVLVNDFGEIGIDEVLIGEASDDPSILSLANGCVCCSLAEGFAETLGKVREMAHRLDRVVVEVSGVGEPAKVARWSRTPGFSPDGVVVVVDGSRIGEQLEDRRIGETVAAQVADADLLLLTRADLLDDEVVVAVGEAGLDFHYDHSPRGVQVDVFAAQVALANERAMPLVIHTREAWEETFAVLDAEGVPERTVFHCFTGGPDEGAACLERGALLSFSGIVTFKGAVDVRAAAAACPLDRAMVETDSPYLAPVPHRGRPNRPALVAHVGEALAAAMDRPVAEVAEVTSATACGFYGLTIPDSSGN